MARVAPCTLHSANSCYYNTVTGFHWGFVLNSISSGSFFLISNVPGNVMSHSGHVRGQMWTDHRPIPPPKLSWVPFDDHRVSEASRGRDVWGEGKTGPGEFSRGRQRGTSFKQHSPDSGSYRHQCSRLWKVVSLT